MATLRKRKNKSGRFVYLVDFYYEGKRFVRSTKTDDLKTARLILKDIEAKIAKNAFNVEELDRKEKVYLEQFIEEFLQYSETHKAPKTFKRDKLTFDNFLRFAGNRSLSSIDRKLIDNYLFERVQEVKKSTANIELRHLKAAFTKAKEWGYIDENPCKGAKQFQVPQSAPKFFSEDEMLRLLEAIGDSWLKDLVIVAVDTGLRVGELVNLKWNDVNFESQMLTVRNTSDFTTKSKRERVVPLNEEAFNVLVCLKRKGDYVFADDKGNRWNAEHVSKSFKKFVRVAELGEHFSFHSLRHTFASYLVMRGTSLYKVSKLLGHSSLKTTEVYAHLAPETLHEVVNLLGFVKGGGNVLRLVGKKSGELS